MADFSQMKISELIRFAEEQARKEQDHLVSSPDPDRDTSWAATLALLREMKKRGVPDGLAD